MEFSRINLAVRRCILFRSITHLGIQMMLYTLRIRTHIHIQIWCNTWISCNQIHQSSRYWRGRYYEGHLQAINANTW